MLMQERGALELFREAYNNRYTWEPDFPGYRAQVDVTYEGQSGSGSVQIRAMPGAEGHFHYGAWVEGLGETPLSLFVQQQLQDLITHRQRIPFEQAHGSHHFERRQTDATGAVGIIVDGDSMGSHYKIKDRQVCMVSRTLGDVSFEINTRQCLETEQGYLATHFDVVFRDTETQNVVRQDAVECRYESVEGCFLLAEKLIVSRKQEQPSMTHTLEFSDFVILQP